MDALPLLPTIPSSAVPACDSRTSSCHSIDARKPATTGWMPIQLIGNSPLAVPNNDGSGPMIMMVPVRIYSAISGLGHPGYSALEISRDDSIWTALVDQESSMLDPVPELSLNSSALHPWEETNLAPVDFNTGLRSNDDGTSMSQSSSGEEILSLQFPPDAAISTDHAHISSPVLG